MNKEDLDNEIINYFNSIGNMPKEVEQHIKNVNLKNKKTIKYKIIQIIKIMIASVTLLGSTVLAVNYISKYSNIYDSGVKRAIENGYVYEPEEIIYNSNESLKAGIDSIVFDDYNLNIDVLLHFNEDVNIEGYEHVYAENVIIYDEQNNVYYYDNWNMVKQFIEKQKLIEENLKLVSNNSNVSIYNVNKNTGTLNFAFKENSHKFPQSKEIYVEFEQIKFKGNVDKNKKDLSFTGDWKTKINIPQKFQDRESTTYNIQNADNRINKEKFNIQITETGTKVNAELQWGDYEYWTKKVEELRKKDVMSGQLIKIEKCFIENENGEKFSATFDGSGARLNKNGVLEIQCNFSCLKEDCTEQMKITFVDINDKNIEVYYNFYEKNHKR